MFNPKVFVAEFIGTFAVVLVGAAAGVYSTVSSLGMGLLGVAFAHGLTLAVMVYVFGYISGAHVNPAVTLGLALNGTVKWLDAIVYWVAQFAGALLAAFLMKVFLTPINTDLVNSMATHGAFVTGHQYYAMALEAVLTFLLVNTVLHVTVGGKAGPFAGLVIGLTWTVAIMMGGPLTGASLNPARSFGPAVFTSVITAGTPDFQNPMFYLIFFVGPFLGAVVAVLLYQLFKFEFVSADDLDDEEDEDDDEEVVIEEIVVEEVVEKPVARKSTARKATKK